jgi:hypothetical protein
VSAARHSWSMCITGIATVRRVVGVMLIMGG